MISLLGMPFGSLTAACRDQNWMLQVCDLGGIYTLSFPIAMVQGLVADFFLRRSYPPPAGRTKYAPVVSVFAAWAAVAIYGQLRLHQIEAGMKPGPRVAVIQPDVVYVRDSAHSYDPGLLLSKMKQLSEQAAQEGEAPDLFLWPEGISSFPLHNRELFETPHDSRMVQDSQQWDQTRSGMAQSEKEFSIWARELGAPLIVGMNVSLPTAAGESRPFRTYNSAEIYDPEIGQSSGRQFKMRLYPGGEYFPWSDTWVDRTLAQLGILPSVFGVGNRFEPGEKRQLFRLGSAPEISNYAISICSEILSPEGSGVFLPRTGGEKPFDFLVNIANEGTFLRNSAQIHQFAYLRFRAIEARVGIARSSNTGISGFVSPTGEVYDLVTNQDGQARTGLGAPELPLIADLMAFREANEESFKTDANKRAELHRRIAEIQTLRDEAGVEGFSVSRLYTYPGLTLYQRLGDWLGISMLTAFGAMSVASCRMRRHRGS